MEAENIKTVETLCKYIASCPSCNGDITDFEILHFKKCKKCEEEKKDAEFVYTLNVLKKEVENFSKFAFEKFGIHLTAAQINWAKKFFLNQSYSIIFPPGTGKTTFALILVCYLYIKYKKRSYLIVPSQQLLEQVYLKLYSKFPDLNIVAVSKVSKKKNELLKEQIRKGDFSILITTSMFLNKNITIFPVKLIDLY
ncbi:MAG: DEAD/DEAH box helicase, partial [Planctomycetota bacterium]